jgi:hypothetical protein
MCQQKHYRIEGMANGNWSWQIHKVEWTLSSKTTRGTLSALLPAAYTLRTHPTTYHRAPASYKPLPPLTVRPSRMACEPLKTRVWLMGAIRDDVPVTTATESAILEMAAEMKPPGCCPW